MAPPGLGRLEANVRLAMEIERVIKEEGRGWDQRLQGYEFVVTTEGIIALFAILFLVLNKILLPLYLNIQIATFDTVVSLLIIIPFYLVNIWTYKRLRKAEEVRPYVQLQETLDAINECVHALSLDNDDDDDEEGTPTDNSVVWNPPSARSVLVYRSNVWLTMPTIMLANGDLYKLTPGDAFPVDSVNSSISGTPPTDNTIVYKKGTIFTPPDKVFNFSSISSTFEARSFAATPLLQSFIKRSFSHTTLEKRKGISFFNIALTLRKCVLVSFGVLFLGLAVSIITWCCKMDRSSYLFKTSMLDLSLSIPILALSCLPLVFGMMIELTDIWGNARLQSMFQRIPSNEAPPKEARRRRRRKTKFDSDDDASHPHSSLLTSSSSCSSSTSDDDDSRMPLKARSHDEDDDDVSSSRLSIATVLVRDHFSEFITVLQQGLDSGSNLMHILNATTALVFIDKEGLLTNTNMTIKEVCVATDELDVQRGPERNRFICDVVFDIEKRDGLSINSEGTKINAFAGVANVCRLPVADSHLISTQARDLLIHPKYLAEVYRECFCSFTSVCRNINHNTLNAIDIVRFAFVVLHKEDSVMGMCWTIKNSSEGGEPNLQLVTKGAPKHIMNWSKYYFDGENIKLMTSSVRRSLTELLSQWRSGGYESYAISYKPCDSFNDDNSLIQYHKVEDEDQIFLGMVAFQLSTPQEVPARIADFHEGGIRFIYMSRENEITTKLMGRLLGLDTDWNSLISLEPVPNNVNTAGKIIVPSGVEDIKNHLKTTDNVPLQVSFFYNATTPTINEMIKILQENGEIVTCIGSSFNVDSHEIFDQGNCSISVAAGPSSICKMCFGRRAHGYTDRHVFPSLPPEYVAASSLLSLSCALQINLNNQPVRKIVDATPVFTPEGPKLLLELLLEAIKETRRVVDTISSALTFQICMSLCFVAPFILLSNVFCLPSFLNASSVLSLTHIVIPLLAGLLLYSPASVDIMSEHPDRTEGNNLPRLCVLQAIRFFPSCIILIFLSSYHFQTILRILASDCALETVNECGKSQIAFGGRWMRCVDLLHQCREDVSRYLGHTKFLNEFLCLAFSIISAFTFIDKQFLPTNRYPPHIIIGSGLIFAFSSLWIVVEILTSSSLLIAPPVIFYVLVGLWLLISFIVHELAKWQLSREFDLNQKYLQLLFTTKLGMWSPK